MAISAFAHPLFRFGLGAQRIIGPEQMCGAGQGLLAGCAGRLDARLSDEARALCRAPRATIHPDLDLKAGNEADEGDTSALLLSGSDRRVC